MNLDRHSTSFRRLDELFERTTALSLNPVQALATPFTELERSVVRPAVTPKLSTVVGLTLQDILRSMMTNFPENIFWDFDFLVASMVEQALAAREPSHFLNRFSEKLKKLMALFGNRSSVNFRYLHDFLYGFDWTKWVQKAPGTRQHYGPFSFTFLDYLAHRGRELLALIAEDDQTYRRLVRGTYRNPFSFSREPGQEAQLFKQLAARHLIPVAAWDKDTRPSWNKPFYLLREQLASELHLSTST